ncbi:MAG: putative signal transducing protein [Roseiflexaceae bacterium]
MWQWFRNMFGSAQTTPAPSEPVVVMICEGQVEASMYQAQLHDAGIPSALIGADSAAVFGMQSGLLASVRIVVPAAHADAAIELLAQSAPDDDDTAPTTPTPPVRTTADIDDSADV